MSTTTAKAAAPGGRPKKADHERRVRQPKIRLTIAEENHLRKKAAAAGKSFTDYVRDRALGPASPAPPTDQPEGDLVLARLLRELNAIGINLNQLTRNYHTGRDGVIDWEHVKKELLRVLAKVGDQFP